MSNTTPRKNRSLLVEFFRFMKAEKKWWLLPLLLVLLLLALVAIFGQSSPLAPFIYTFF